MVSRTIHRPSSRRCKCILLYLKHAQQHRDCLQRHSCHRICMLSSYSFADFRTFRQRTDSLNPGYNRNFLRYLNRELRSNNHNESKIENSDMSDSWQPVEKQFNVSIETTESLSKLCICCHSIMKATIGGFFIPRSTEGRICMLQ